MTRGDIVKHKLSGEVYRVLKVGENCAICQCPPHTHKFYWMWTIWESYICLIENLEPYPQGKEIFDWLDSFNDDAFPNRWKQLMKVKHGTQLSLI
jgi:hypothetical protein